VNLTKVEQIVDRIVRLCQKRSPEALDKIFDTMHVGLTQTEAENLSMQVTQLTTAALRADSDTLAWWCGYMASEINSSADNNRQNLRITMLSRTLIDVGLMPFQDFVPYPGRRLILVDSARFATLPPSLQQAMHDLFDMDEKTGEEVDQINEAIRQELVVYRTKESN
jgi:BarA-like signal transduction histidine kinase